MISLGLHLEYQTGIELSQTAAAETVPYSDQGSHPQVQVSAQ